MKGSFCKLGLVLLLLMPFQVFSADKMLLSVNASSQSVQLNDYVIVTGRLIRLPEDGQTDLSKEKLELIILEPDGTEVRTINHTIGNTNNKPDGYYEINLNHKEFYFTKTGLYTLILKYAGSAAYEAKTVTTTVRVSSHAGYAVIVQGAFDNADGNPNNDGLQEHAKTVDRIYSVLRNRNFEPQNIYYFNYSSKSGAQFDDSPSRDEILDIFTGSNSNFPLIDKMVNDPAPVYLIMVDHGSQDYFFIDDGIGDFDPKEDTITPEDLNNAFNAFEEKLLELKPSALTQSRTLIYGACYAGAFLPLLSQPAQGINAGRTIITSSAADEVSYQGSVDPVDGIRSGEFFIDALFDQLEKGYSFKDSFRSATEDTEIFTQGDTGQENSAAPYFDNAVQHPLLDDNGDRQGSNLLADAGEVDGMVSANHYLGFGNGPAVNDETTCDESDEIYLTASTVILGPGTDPENTSSTLGIWTERSQGIDYAWIEIRKPGQVLQPQPGNLQVVSNFVQFDLTSQDINDNFTLWTVNLDNFFQEEGRYDIFYYAGSWGQTETISISEMSRSVVYKQLEGNNPPAAFEYKYPQDGVTQSSTLYFDWSNAGDPDNDAVRYELQISELSNFSEIAFQKTDLRGTSFRLGECDNLKDLTQYFWRVVAIDEYGNKTAGPTQSFNTDNTNGIPGILQGIISSDLDLSLLSSCDVTSSIQEGIFATSDATGEYVLLLNEGLTNITAALTNFVNSTTNDVNLQAGKSTILNFALSPDSDNDGTPDVDDDFPEDDTETTDTDGDGIGNNADTDDDNDGMTDVYEDANGLQRLVDDASEDLDSDGYTNLEEFQAGTAANDSGDTPRRSKAWRAVIPFILDE